MVAMGLGRLADCIKKSGQKSCRKLAELFNTSKSSIHRKQRKIKSRENIMGSKFFETEEGQLWLARLVVAAIFVFGSLSAVGSERISLFFSLLSITAFIGLSSSSVRKIENQIDDLIVKFKKNYDEKIKERADQLEITPGADETYFEKMMLIVLMDLKSGFIFVEKPEQKRDHQTWEKNSMPWLDKFKTVRCFLSDKAQALLKLAKTSLKVSRIPDLFHMMYDVSKVMRYSFHRMSKKIEKKILETNKLILNGVDLAKNKVLSVKLTCELRRISFDQKVYQRNQRKLSISLHPFEILSAKKQTTLVVETKMKTALEAIKSIQKKREIPDSGKKLNRTERQIPDSAKLVDQWWGWVNTSLDSSDLSPERRDWLVHSLLPFIYWKSQIKKTRSKKIKRFYQISTSIAEKNLHSHPLSNSMFGNAAMESEWIAWAKNMTNIFIRTTSAIEGRNAWLSQIYFNGRGLSEKRILAQAAIRNYYLKRADGTTACERLSQIKPEDLFEYVFKNFESLPEPRKSKFRIEKSVDPPILAAVPA